MDSPNRVLVRGVGDVGSAVAVILHRAGYGVALHDEPATPTPRRGMAFADAIFDGWATLDGLTAIRVQTPAELRHALNAGRMPNAPRSWTWARWAVIRRRSQLRRRSCRCSSGPQARTVQRQDRRPRRRVLAAPIRIASSAPNRARATVHRGSFARDPSVTLGVLSLVIWTLILVTTIKYVTVAMRVCEPDSPR